jgi:hypothetical protein
MSARITDRIRNFLLNIGTASIEQVIAAIPELEFSGGSERARLLIRLDPQLERTSAGLWTIRSHTLSDERKVRLAAEEYFRALGRPGAPLSSASTELSERTSVNVDEVKRILAELYLVQGPNIFNRRKQQKEG